MPVQPRSSEFPNIGRTHLVQQVRDELERAIEEGRYGPGQRLPSERQLTESFGVSRVCVREAISGLVARNIVEVQHGRGCFVVQRPSDVFADSFSTWIASHAGELREMLMVRGALESLAVEEVARMTDPDAIALITDAHEAFRRAAEGSDVSVDEMVARDVDFHVALARASGSSLLASLLEDLHQRLTESRIVTLGGPRSQVQRSLAQHERIVDGILARDGKAAAAAIQEHVHSVLDAVDSLLEAQQEGRPGD